MGIVHVRSSSMVLVLGLGLVLPSLSCDQETTPGIPITLETIWPNENGRAWDYILTRSEFDHWWFPDSANVYENIESVPPAPPIESILPFIDHPPLPDSVHTETDGWRLEFRDSITTGSGVTAQNLMEIPSGYSGNTAYVAQGEHEPSSLLAHILDVRSGRVPRWPGAGDLRPSAAETVNIGFPLLLHGGAWEKTTDWIGTYGDFDARRVWKFLDPTLTPGHSFSHTVIENLPVVLHGYVRRQVSIDTPVGTFTDALEVVYLLDYGIVTWTDVFHPDRHGYSRMILYGNVIYAPTIGPVALYERDGVTVGPTLGFGFGDESLLLNAVSSILTLSTSKL
jgi:hypothetical protein